MVHHVPLALVLAALLLALPVHGWSMGVMARIAGVAVLCAPSGPEVVATDRHGAPVGAMADCPDCVPGFGVAPPLAPPDIFALQAPTTAAVTRPHAPPSSAQAQGLRWPRAPPIGTSFAHRPRFQTG